MKKHSEIDWTKFINLGMKLVGKPYVFGSENDLKDPDPDHILATDCSELCEWLYAQIGLELPDGSYNQAKVCTKLEPGAKVLIGDLGMKANPENGVVHHVGVYIGDDKVLEAKGKQWGVIITPVKSYEASSHFIGFYRHRQIIDA